MGGKLTIHQTPLSQRVGISLNELAAYIGSGRTKARELLDSGEIESWWEGARHVASRPSADIYIQNRIAQNSTRRKAG
jgi:hypothetical protein